jgi:hypothetical protein
MRLPLDSDIKKNRVCGGPDCRNNTEIIFPSSRYGSTGSPRTALVNNDMLPSSIRGELTPKRD